jgi:DNA repair exonuclease SbcCD nuclease subunit
LGILVLADTHFTSLPKDEYRWQIFDVLKYIHKNNHGCLFDEIIILGDLTEKMDNHPSKLVNRLVNNLKELCELGISITILKGNHDFYEETEPYFEFLNSVNNISFVTEISLDNRGFLFLPYSNNTAETLQKFIDYDAVECVFMHHTISSALLNDNFRLKTDNTIKNQTMVNTFKNTLILSGHVHVPQTINNVIYVGSPYSIDNGDHWRGRGILLDIENSSYEEIPFNNSYCKWRFDVKSSNELLDIFSENKILKSDSMLIRVCLDYTNSHDYTSIKQEIKNFLKKKDFINYSIRSKIESKKRLSEINKINYKEKLTPKDKLIAYSKSHKLKNDIINIGLELLN